MSDDPDAQTRIGTLEFLDGNIPGCLACRGPGVCRLGVTSEAVEDEVLTARLRCPKSHEGGPGVAHGGWIASVLDECVGHLGVHLGAPVVTGKLTVEFLRPVPIETDLVLHARVDGKDGRYWRLAGDLAMPQGDTVLAAAEGTWVERRPDHFARHQSWLAEQQ